MLGSAGRLLSTISIPEAGVWEVWVKGQLMRPLRVSIDGRELTTVSGQLDGNSLVVGSAPPIEVRLGAGTHQLELERGGSSLAPGDGGAAVLNSVVLTPAAAGGVATLRTVGVARWRTLCGSRYQWAELIPEAGAARSRS